MLQRPPHNLCTLQWRMTSQRTPKPSCVGEWNGLVTAQPYETFSPIVFQGSQLLGWHVILSYLEKSLSFPSYSDKNIFKKQDSVVLFPSLGAEDQIQGPPCAKHGSLPLSSTNSNTRFFDTVPTNLIRRASSSIHLDGIGTYTHSSVNQSTYQNADNHQMPPSSFFYSNITNPHNLRSSEVLIVNL